MRAPPLPHQFEQAVRAHERFASGRPGGMRLILRFGQLPGVMLQRRDLRGIDLTGCNLEGARLAAATLSEAALYCCNLRNADLRAGDLVNADLRGVSLKGADLYGARLDGADFRDARLAQVQANGLFKVWSADGARERTRFGPDGDVRLGVDFRHASMKRTRLGGSRLQGADFSDANLTGASFEGANLEGARFANTILTGVDLTAARLDPAALTTAILDPDADAVARASELRLALDRFEDHVMGNGRGEAAEFAGADLRPLGDVFAGRQLAGLSAPGARAIDIRFNGSLLAGANFRGADLRGADFSGCDLRGASFAGCRLGFARFTGATFGPLTIRDGRRLETDLSDAETTGAAFDAAHAPWLRAGLDLDDLAVG